MPTVEITKANHDAILYNTPGTVVLFFYAPWCGFCKQFEPTWNQVANERLPGVTFARVNESVSRDIVEAWGIRGFPTLYRLKGGRIGPNGGDFAEMEQFQGPRTPEGLREFALG